MSRVGVIAGEGVLPMHLARHLRPNAPVIVDFGVTKLDWASEYEVIPVRFERPAAVFKKLRLSGVTQIVMAGGMARPRLNPMKFDRVFLRKSSGLLGAMRMGDDALLRFISAWFEEEGFEIIGAHQILETLLAPNGVWGRITPSEEDQRDIDRGVRLLDHLAPEDIAQACVISQGICFGIETIQGTDALLNFVKSTDQKFNPPRVRSQGVLVKLPKKGQHERIDLPTIGEETVRNAHAAGLSGIALRANSSIVLEIEKVIALADQHELFLVGISA